MKKKKKVKVRMLDGYVFIRFGETKVGEFISTMSRRELMEGKINQRVEGVQGKENGLHLR